MCNWRRGELPVVRTDWDAACALYAHCSLCWSLCPGLQDEVNMWRQTVVGQWALKYYTAYRLNSVQETAWWIVGDGLFLERNGRPGPITRVADQAKRDIVFFLTNSDIIVRTSLIMIDNGTFLSSPYKWYPDPMATEWLSSFRKLLTYLFHVPVIWFLYTWDELLYFWRWNEIEEQLSLWRISWAMNIKKSVLELLESSTYQDWENFNTGRIIKVNQIVCHI